MADPLAPYFLGPWAENNDLFEKVLVELVRDHMYWRRNFHPDDAPPIATTAQFEGPFQERFAGMTRELHRLTALLKRSVPSYHPRYIGHMTSDLLLPGLLAQLVTTLYNPNNIVEETAPVTLGLEQEVGQALCRMMGSPTDPTKTPCAAGHLTSGGTLANDESLWLARAVKLLPLAMKDACEALAEWPLPEVKDDDRALLGWTTHQCLSLLDALQRHPPLARAVHAARVETSGLARFAQRHPVVAELTVLAPASAHYSWAKAMKLLGLGTAQLELVPTREGRVDVDAMRAAVRRRDEVGAPVLAMIGVYGTTEFGALDELHELSALRQPGRAFWLHVDAAWGGYIPSLFRAEDGTVRERSAIAADFRFFPSERVYRSTLALSEADSITVDPHKLGFVPFGAGAFLARDRRAFDLAMQQAPYLFEGGEESRYTNAGRFSLEGSRPGAAAAAVAVNHRVLPLDHAHFGQLIGRSVHACEALYAALPRLRDELAPIARIAIPFEPDCNVVGLSFNPRGNRSLAAANAFTRTVYEALAPHPKDYAAGGQLAAFFGSCTTVPLGHLVASDRARLATTLDLELEQADAPGLFFLRHTLMNPWLQSSPGPGVSSWIEAYLAHLASLVRGAAARSATLTS